MQYMTRCFRVGINEPAEEQVEECSQRSVHHIQAGNPNTVDSYSVLLHKKQEYRTPKAYFLQADMLAGLKAVKSIYTTDGMKVGIEGWQAPFKVSF